MQLPLFRRRLIFVTGKGGVGKTTVALALGLAAARSGLRTIVADLNGEGDPQETEIAPKLFRISVDPQSAMEEYFVVKLPGAAGQALRQSRLFSAFAMATPGMRELLCMGKLWELAQLERRTRDAAPYDLVIVDAPASGHGAAILRTPRTFAEIARVGPIANQAQTIAGTIADPDFTAVVAVSTPEEMPVNETLQLHEALASVPDPLEFQAVILNARYPDRFTAVEAASLTEALAVRPVPQDRTSIYVALAEYARATREAAQERRLRDAFGERLLVLPFLFEPRLQLPQLKLLAQELER
ncbi:MAG TPA: ArsA-related P-loop ATPase [Solirubrobacteraceae bacterium]|nr:ArsA-related P-loop ATPase [Solirubrobacteraceae bacterium]